MKIFVSNHLEVLAKLLKEELFQESSHPFDKHSIIVQSERIKQDLFLQWAHDPVLQVAAGCKMISWSEAISRLFPHVPSQAELSLEIEAALHSIHDDALLAYLNQGGFQRKASLSDRMSTLFLQYLNQPEEKLQQWLEKTGWQQVLWKTVFTHEIPWKNQNTLEGSVYLFHPFHIAPYQLEAFKKMEATCFLFSPCAMFWGDFHTSHEQGYLLKRAPVKTRKELLQFFENEHPLLANWGRKARQLLSFFEDEEWIDEYQETPGASVLKTIQEEMLTLSIKDKAADESIQIHSAASALREVEIVWEIIQRLPFKPSEILVLAPDMQIYAPFVELVFHQRGGPFDFAIFGLEARSKSPLMQGLETLLELSHYRFSKEAVEKLLFCPPFLKKFDFSIEDAHLLLKWFNEVHIRYDLYTNNLKNREFDKEGPQNFCSERATIVDRQGASENNNYEINSTQSKPDSSSYLCIKGDHPGTWQEGLKRLVEALVTTVKDNQLSIDFSDADVLNKWIKVFQLFEGISEEERSLKEWSKTLKSLVSQFFAPDPDDLLMRELEKFQQMEIDGKFPLSSIERILKNIFQQKSGAVHGSHLQAVRFTTLEKGALIPAKAVILMGMEEGSFPRQDLPSSLQQLVTLSRIEEDKYLFLEAFCSARETFIMTYLRIHPEDGKSQKACPMVEELSNYGSIPITDHPFSPFDASYYQETGFRSFSKIHFDALKKTAFEPKVPLLPPVPISAIDIRMLRSLARHPLKYFYEERLGIDFEWKEHNTEFTISPLDMIQLRKASLKIPLEVLLSEMEKEGKLPVGAFSKAAVQKIRDEIETYHEMLCKLQVSPDEIYSIELKSSCKKAEQIDAHTWIYPALHIDGVMIQGRIDDMSSKGLLFHGEDTLADQLKVWPLLLIVSQLGLSGTLLLTKKGKISEIKPSPDSLEKYIRYAKKALTIPSPLHPKWTRGLFKEGKIPASEQDEIIEWTRLRNLLPPSDLWLQAWDPYLREVVDELL